VRKPSYIVVCAGIALFFSWASHAQEVLEGIVAVVGDEIILRTQLIQAAQGFALQMGVNPRNQPQEFEKIKDNILQNLINEKVLLAKAIEDTVTVDDQQVESALESRIEELTQQLGSKERVEAYFGSPIRKIKRDYRDEIRKQLIVSTVQQEKLRDIKVSRNEVISFFETMKDSLPDQKPRVKLRHILIDVRPGERAKQQAMERMREIQERIRQGEDFSELAKLYSEDPGTASNGGALGFVEKGTLFQSFEETAFQMESGEISDVVETPVGLHLIQLIEKRGDKASMRHILIRVEVTSVDESTVLDTLRRVRERVLAGESFEDMAQKYSQDETTKDLGGDLGWLPPDQLQIEAFKSAIDTLQTDEITRPFKTQFGYHIVKLEGRRGARKVSLEEDWEQVEYWALSTKRQKVIEEWIAELRKKIYIRINEDML